MVLDPGTPSAVSVCPLGSDAGPGRFFSTAWSMILQVQRNDRTTSRKYMGLLIQRYWRPVFFFIKPFVDSHDDAKDLAQGFFVSFLERNAISCADRTRGRFRNFLLASVKLYMRQRHRAWFLHGGPAPASYGDIAARLWISEKDVSNHFERSVP